MCFLLFKKLYGASLSLTSNTDTIRVVSCDVKAGITGLATSKLLTMIDAYNLKDAYNGLVEKGN